MQESPFIYQFIEEFEYSRTISTENIINFFRKITPNITRNTINWRISKLIKQGVISRVSKGDYRFGAINNYNPIISNGIKSIYQKVIQKFPYTEICVWHTDFIKEFTHHSINLDCNIIEIERSAVNSIYLQLKDTFPNIYLKPSSTRLNDINQIQQTSIIVLPLVTEAPLQMSNKIQTISLEKLLVDIFADEIWSSLQGYELLRIFENAINKYSINTNKLLRYASRKGKKEELINFIKINKLLII